MNGQFWSILYIHLRQTNSSYAKKTPCTSAGDPQIPPRRLYRSCGKTKGTRKSGGRRTRDHVDAWSSPRKRFFASINRAHRVNPKKMLYLLLYINNGLSTECWLQETTYHGIGRRIIFFSIKCTNLRRTFFLQTRINFFL